MEVSGVRRSWETESNIWLSRARAVSNPAAMALIERVSESSSSTFELVTGTRALSSPAAILLVAALASTSGRVIRLLSCQATMPATTSVMPLTRTR